MENKCFLCMGVTGGLDDLINIHADEWKEDNIQGIIEKHLWSMASMKSKSSWLCSACWLVIHEFHQFYKRIEDIQTYFEDAVKSVNKQMKENCFLQNITPITELDESEIDVQQLLKPRANDFKANASRGIDNRSTKTDSLKCPKCPQKLNDKQAIEWHVAWHGGTHISCEICDLIFIDKYELIKHKQIHAPSQNHEPKRNVTVITSPHTMEKTSTESEVNTIDFAEVKDDTDSSISSVEFKCMKQFQCQYCSTEFSYKRTYLKHIAEHEVRIAKGKAIFGNNSSDSNNLMKQCFRSVAHHENIRVKEKQQKNATIKSKFTKQFKCQYCSTEFSYERAYFKHIAEHELRIAKGKAKIGNNSSDSNNLLKQSFISVAHHENIRVKEEQQENAIIENIVVQDLGNHNATSKISDASNLLKESFRCKFCRRELETEQALLSHKAWHQRKVLLCSICDLRFLDKIEYEKHRLAHDQFPAEPDLQYEEEEIYMCTVCSTVLNSRQLYINHNAWHKGTIYRCEICDMKFLDKCHFDGHTESHMPKSSKRCRECHKPFTTATEVLLHYEKVHKNAFQNVCHVCGKNYRCPVSFKRHVDKHNGIPDEMLPCKICGRVLTTKAGLKSHMKINHPEGGVLPYVCNICMKPIATRSMLNTHIRLYHKTTGFDKNCSNCGKRFKNYRQFKNHAKIHSAEKKYACKWCPKKFYLSALLYKHKRRAHPTEYAKWKKQQYVEV